jgi:hypothetical protein
MKIKRRRCTICNRLTENWQRVNGGPWYCYDGCFSTTGYDRRTKDGKPFREQSDEEQMRIIKNENY